eukprot:1134835-Pelagomonas_calceolata.AAC.1
MTGLQLPTPGCLRIPGWTPPDPAQVFLKSWASAFPQCPPPTAQPPSLASLPCSCCCCCSCSSTSLSAGSRASYAAVAGCAHLLHNTLLHHPGILLAPTLVPFSGQAP